MYSISLYQHKLAQQMCVAVCYMYMCTKTLTIEGELPYRRCLEASRPIQIVTQERKNATKFNVIRLQATCIPIDTASCSSSKVLAHARARMLVVFVISACSVCAHAKVSMYVRETSMCHARGHATILLRYFHWLTLFSLLALEITVRR